MRLFAPLALVVLLAPAAARAAEPTDVDRDLARASVQKGDELVEKGDYAGALKAYRYADDIMKVPTTSIEVVHMELKLGHLVEAFEACYRTTRYPEKPHEPPPFTRARKEALELISTLKKRIPRLSIVVVPQNSDAVPSVTIDDKPIDAYGDVPLNPGDHHLTASAKGHVAKGEDVHLEEGDAKTVALDLVLEPPPPEPVAPPPSWQWPMAYAGFGVAAAGVIVGSVTGGLMFAAKGDLDKNCGDLKHCPSDQQATLDHAYAMASVSTASFLVAGAGAVVGVTGLIVALRRRRPEPPPLAIAPLFDGRGRPALGLAIGFTR